MKRPRNRTGSFLWAAATVFLVILALSTSSSSAQVQTSQPPLSGQKITICHNPGPHQRTMQVPFNAVPSHLSHGDTLGACGTSCACDLVFDPVTCSNGEAYANACFATCAGATDCGHICACDPRFDPVTCSNGITYGNVCFAACAGGTGCVQTPIFCAPSQGAALASEPRVKGVSDSGIKLTGQGRDPVGVNLVGGTDAARGEFPWTVSIESNGGFTCAGVLISADRVLTAAHCVAGALPSSLKIRAGILCRSEAILPHDVSSYTVHEGSNQGGNCSMPDDIAIVNVSEPFAIGGDIQLATLPADNSNDFVGEPSVVAGWGQTSSSTVLPDCLQKGITQVIGTAQANALMATALMVPVLGAQVCDTNLALYDSAQQVGTCVGDDGGPVHVSVGGIQVVAGIVSWQVCSGGTCLQSVPSIATRVSSYLDWIASH